jgi:cell wall-associated NlpC family hydrolase
MEVELKGMQSQIKDQKAETVNMKAKIEEKESETAALKQSLENKDAGLEAQIASIRENIKKEEERKAAEKADLDRAAEEVNTSNSSSEGTSSSSSKESSSASKAESSASGSSKGESSSNSSKNSSADKPAAASKPAASKTETSSKPSSANTGSAITAGYKYIGNSTYKFGGGRTASDIANGLFDCSGFVAWAYKQAGVNLPASTDALKNAGRQVSKSQIQPGDLVFFNTYKTDGHVGIYVGGGKFIGSQSSTGVAIANMESGYWAGVFNGRVVRVN